MWVVVQTFSCCLNKEKKREPLSQHARDGRFRGKGDHPQHVPVLPLHPDVDVVHRSTKTFTWPTKSASIWWSGTTAREKEGRRCLAMQAQRAEARCLRETVAPVCDRHPTIGGCVQERSCVKGKSAAAEEARRHRPCVRSCTQWRTGRGQSA